jgi:hypothetical protein
LGQARILKRAASYRLICVLVTNSSNMALQKDDVLRHQTEKLGDVRSSDMERGDVSEILDSGETQDK